MSTFLVQPHLASLIGMPPQVMLVVTLAGIIYLFRRDFREKPNVTRELWLPTVWLFIICSRPITQWLHILGVPIIGATSVEEGSPIDALGNFVMMALGFHILIKRRVSLQEFFRNNPFLALFFAYCFVAIFWSDFPFTSLKRYLKIFSHPIMILVILSEPDPLESLTRVMKRCSYVLFPVSILWIKYYLNLGRSADEWGNLMNDGVTGGKNQLGAICLTFGLFLLWHLMQVWRTPKGQTRKNEIKLDIGLLLLIAYCLRKSHSSTSTISFILAVLIMVLVGLRSIDKRQIGLYAAATFVILLFAQLTFDLYGTIVDLSGHESTLEGRGHLWEVLLQTDTNPIFGTGFESFWLGNRMQGVWDMIVWHPTEAHNGYLEAYLNLGAVGLVCLLSVIVAGLWKCRQDLLTRFEWGRFTLAYLIAIIIHNWTEAGFKGLSVMFFGLFLAGTHLAIGNMHPLDVSRTRSEPEKDPDFSCVATQTT